MRISLINIHENKNVNVVNALFLLLLAVSGNYVGETLGCQTQKLFAGMWTKELLTIFIIYFSIDLTNGGNQEHPMTNIFTALKVWICYLLFTKMDIIPTIMVILMLISIYVSENYRKYYQENSDNVDDFEEMNKSIQKYQSIVFNLSILVVFVGFIFYLIEKRQEYKKNFDIFKFILGVRKCKGLK